MTDKQYFEIGLVIISSIVLVVLSKILFRRLKRESQDESIFDNSYTIVNCFLFFCVLITFISIIITVCSFPATEDRLKFDFIKSLDTPDWISIWISVIDIMISFTMTYLIFKYDKDVQYKQQLEKQIIDDAKNAENMLKQQQADFEKAQREQQEAFEKKQKESVAVTQWASVLNFNSCIVSNLYYKDPIELTVINNVKQNYDGVVKIELSSRTPLPIFLEFDIKEIEINTLRIVNNDNLDSKIPVKFSSIKAIDNSCKKIDKKSDCLFQFYTSRSRTHFEFYLFYKENDSRKKEVAESLLYFSNHFEHINRIEMTITGSLSDKSGYYMVPQKKEPFSIKLLGRVQFEDGPSIEITTVNYSSDN